MITDHPKKFTMLGEIPIDNKCVVERADRDEKGLGPMFHLEVTCTQQSRTYYMLTAEQEQRDTWYKLICEDAGVQGLEHDSDEHGALSWQSSVISRDFPVTLADLW